MSNATLPKINVWADWDGDGFINKGLATDPRNLITNPLTLLNAVALNVSGPNAIYPKYSPTINGLFKYSSTASTNVTYLGFNKGSAGSFAAFFTPTATGTYTLQFDIKGIVGAAFSVTAKNIYNNPSDGTGLTVSPVTINITSSSATFRPVLTFTVNTLTNMQVGFEISWSSGNKVIDVSGAMVMSGTVPAYTYFNVGGNLSKYDNLSADVMAAQWQLGHTGPFDNVPSEGTASITLRNTTFKYSPEHSSSPFYSVNVGTDVNFPAGHYPYTFPVPAYKEGVVISIEIQNDSGIAYEMWRGFLDTIVPGSMQTEPSVVLSAVQGWFKFGQVKINPQAILSGITNSSTGISAYNLITYLLTNYATFAKCPNMATVNKTTGDHRTQYDILSATGTFIADNIYAGYLYTSVGQAWSSQTTLAEAIQDLMLADQSSFFIMRDGSGWYRFRDAFYTNNPSYPLNASEVTLDDLLTNADDYKIVQTEVNSVKLDYYPAASVTGQLWYSKAPLVIGPKQTKTFVAKIQYPEGGKVQVQSVNAFNALVSPSTAVAKNSTGATYGKQAFRIKTNNRGTEVDIIITNSSTNTYYIDVVLNGTSYVTAGSATVYKQIPTSFGPLGTREQAFSSKLITTEAQANGLASHILSLIGGRYTTYPSISVSSRDATWLQRILDNTLGQRIKFRATAYTGSIYHRAVIIGESAQWTPGILSMTYTLRPADQYDFLNTDVTYYKLGGLVY